MPAPPFQLRVFQGENPRISRQLIGESTAQTAFNLRLTSGRIDPVYGPSDVSASMQSGIAKSMYRMYDSGGTDYWLNWTADVDVVKGPVAGDTSFRIYFASDEFEPRVTNFTLATGSTPYPDAWYVLGVTPPVTAPTVSPSGGSPPTVTRTYVYTFVTAWGEESAPSPASSSATGNEDGTWAISNMDVAPLNTFTVTTASWSASVATYTMASTFGTRVGEYITITGVSPSGYNVANAIITAITSTTISIAMASDPGAYSTGGSIARDAPHNTTSMMKRVYRSVTSTLGTAYYFSKEIAVATTSTNDDVGSAIGEILPTTGWAMPPVSLRGLKVLPSGALIGFTGNQVCFSEPLAPYAWPTSYQLITDYDVVAIGTFGQSAVVATKGSPYVGSGVEPASFSLTKLDQNWPCLSKRGLTETGDGVTWPAPQGLVKVGINGSQLLTDNSYTYIEWADLNPSSFISTFHDNRYYGGYQIDAQNYGILVRDAAGMTYRMSNLITGIYTDPGKGALYIIEDNSILEWDSNRAYRVGFEWLSKEFVLPAPINYGAARIEADFATTPEEEAAYASAIAVQNAANAAAIAALTTGGSFNAKSVNTYSLNGSSVVPNAYVGDGGLRYVTFELYNEGELFYSTTLNSDYTFRLPSGVKYDQISIRLLGSVQVNSVVMGDTAYSLRAVP